MTTESMQQLDPESLVARILAELQANPEAQQLLLRAMLTNEFLGMPARLDRIEKDVAEMRIDIAALKADVSELKTDVSELKEDTRWLKDAVGYLIGSDLEIKLHRRARARLSQDLGLRRTRIMQSQLLEPLPEFADPVNDAFENGVITAEQDERITETDFVVRAQRRSDSTTVWIAVEVSSKVDARDIQRARETADALAAIFATEAIAVAAGYRIDPPDRARAAAENVVYVEVPPEQLGGRFLNNLYPDPQ